MGSALNFEEAMKVLLSGGKISYVLDPFESGAGYYTIHNGNLLIEWEDGTRSKVAALQTDVDFYETKFYTC